MDSISDIDDYPREFIDIWSTIQSKRKKDKESEKGQPTNVEQTPSAPVAAQNNFFEIFIPVFGYIPSNLNILVNNKFADAIRRFWSAHGNIVKFSALTVASLYLYRRSFFPKFRHDNRIVLVTDCHTNLGYALAKESAKLGFLTLAGYSGNTNKSRLRALSTSYGQVYLVPLDYRRRDSTAKVTKYLNYLLQDNSSLVFHALVIAGSDIAIDDFPKLDLPGVERVLGESISSILSLSWGILPHVARLVGERTEARLILASSYCAEGTIDNAAAHFTSSAAVKSWAKSLRTELSSVGLPVIELMAPTSFYLDVRNKMNCLGMSIFLSQFAASLLQIPPRTRYYCGT